MAGPVTLLLIYSSLIWPLMEGTQVTCYIKRNSTVIQTSNQNCQNMTELYDDQVSLEECCAKNTQGNLFYYIGGNLQRILGLATCLPCPVPIQAVNPCDNNDICPQGTVCKAKPSGKVKCVIPKPVCGTDGETYITEHELRKKAHRNPGLEVAYDGTCQIGCDNVVCRKNGTCISDQYNRANCVKYCNVHCSGKKIKPLCGADGVQYNNICHLRMETCRRGKTIGLAYEGKCIAKASCDNINCGKKVCVEDQVSGRPRCISCSCSEQDCPGKYNPMTFCGSDNKTYKNYTSLRKQMCTTKSFIKVAHLGPCPDDPLRQGTSPEVPSSQLKHPSPGLTSEDIAKYYISLKNFVNILKREYGLNITAPKYKRLKPWEKIVLMSGLIDAFKRKMCATKGICPGCNFSRVKQLLCQPSSGMVNDRGGQTRKEGGIREKGRGSLHLGVANQNQNNHSGQSQRTQTNMYANAMHEEMCASDATRQSTGLGNVPIDQSGPQIPKLYSEDIANYSIQLRHFVNILKRDYNLDIASPKYKRLRSKDKVVVMKDLLDALKAKWRKIKNWQ